MKNLQCKLTRKRWLEIGVSVLLFVLIIAWALVLEYTEPDREATAARKRFFAVARVTDILDDNAETQDWTEGRRIGQQYLEVEILNGPWKGETLEAILSMFGDRMGKLLLKQAVEQNVCNHILASDTDIDAATYQKMRGMSYQEVLRTNGQISFPEVLRREKAL